MPTPEDRLARIEQREIELEVRLQHISDVVDLTERRVKEIMLELGGVPDVSLRRDRMTIRDRLHKLEASVTATALSAAMADAITAEQPLLRNMMGQVVRERRNRSFSTAQKVVLFTAAIAGAAASILRLFGVG